MTILIEPTTAAVAASASKIVRLERGVLTFSADGLAGLETISIEYRAHPKASWVTAQSADGDLILTATRRQIQMHGIGYYRVGKGATLTACGVYAVGDVNW